MFKCSICGKNCKGHGNNPQPINNGECCDECNKKIVLPRRLQDIKNRKENIDGNKTA